MLKTIGLPVNFIFVSDHGMAPVDRENPIRTPSAIDTAKCIIASSGTMTRGEQVYSDLIKGGADILSSDRGAESAVELAKHAKEHGLKLKR